MRRIILVALAIPVIASVAVVAGPPRDVEAQSDGRGWLALGDSYASGEGIPGTNDVDEAKRHQGRHCQRATGEGTDATAWSVSARRTAGDQLGISTFALVACTGATTDEIASQIGEADTRSARDRWELVTLSIGGNDIGFGEVLKGCLDADNLPWGAFDLTPGCDVDEADLRSRVDGLRQKLDRTYDLIASRVRSGGDVVVVGYPHLIEETARWDRWRRRGVGGCEGIQSWDVPMLRSATGYLNEQIGLAVADADVRHSTTGIRFHFLDISQDPYEFSDDPGSRHALCSSDPWLNGTTTSVSSGDFRLERSFHPRQVGHDNTGRVLATLLEGIRLDDSPSPPNADAEVPAERMAELLANAVMPEDSCGTSGSGWLAQAPIQLRGGEGESRLPNGEFGGVSMSDVRVLGIADVDGDGDGEAIVTADCFGSTIEMCCAGRMSRETAVLAVDIVADQVQLLAPALFGGYSGDQPRSIVEVEVDGDLVKTTEMLAYGDQASAAEVGHDPLGSVVVTHALEGGAWRQVDIVLPPVQTDESERVVAALLDALNRGDLQAAEKVADSEVVSELASWADAGDFGGPVGDCFDAGDVSMQCEILAGGAIFQTFLFPDGPSYRVVRVEFAGDAG